MVSETKGSRVKQREEDEKVGEKRVTGEAKKSVRKGGSDGDGRIISLLETHRAQGSLPPKYSICLCTSMPISMGTYLLGSTEACTSPAPYH